MKHYRNFILVIFCLLSGYSHGHVDTIFTIQEDGKVAGPPSKFGDIFIIKKPESNTIFIKIGGREFILPKCITDEIKYLNSATIKTNGSWYHTNTPIPPYIAIQLINLDIHDKFSGFVGHQLMFTLTSGELFEFTEYLPPSEKSQSVKGIDAAIICTKAELETLNYINIESFYENAKNGGKGI